MSKYYEHNETIFIHSLFLACNRVSELMGDVSFLLEYVLIDGLE